MITYNFNLLLKEMEELRCGECDTVFELDLPAGQCD
jgi:hypothetical protein